MTYVARNDIEAEIPPPLLREALDDDRDGEEDEGRLDRILQLASEQVDAALAGVSGIPFTNPPAYARAAALAFACEIIYMRRGVQPNPYFDRAKSWRNLLHMIAEGKLSGGDAIGRAAAELSQMDVNGPMR